KKQRQERDQSLHRILSLSIVRLIFQRSLSALFQGKKSPIDIDFLYLALDLTVASGRGLQRRFWLWLRNRSKLNQKIVPQLLHGLFDLSRPLHKWDLQSPLPYNQLLSVPHREVCA